MTSTIDLILIQVAGDGGLTCDGEHPYSYRWHDRPVDYACHVALNNLTVDGLLHDPQADGERLAPTDAGWAALSS